MSKEVTHDGQGAFRIRFPFNRSLVDLVKTLPSRRWNPTEKYWSVPEDQVLTLVELLHGQGFGFDEATRRLYLEQGGALVLLPTQPPARSAQQDLFSQAGDVDMNGDRFSTGDAADYTVGRLNDEVKAVLEGAFPAPVWLVGEVSGFNKSSHRRHVTFHLVERDEGGKTIAEINATLFEATRREIGKKLRDAGDPFELTDEITVRLLARVELYAPWGMYRVVVEDLDVHYTLGEVARRREEIVRRLTEEGIVGLNTSLAFPLLPLRVGLITSLGSDAFNDVVRTLQESGLAFELTAHGARVQGRQTEPSVLNALDWFRERASSFDVILICRGGGSRIDLAWFDSEPLGRAVAGFPLPVVVGIGHEKDYSVLDAVGWRSKTPTAAAAGLVENVRAFLELVVESGRSILEMAARRLRQEDATHGERGRRLVRAARNLLERESSELHHRQRRTVRGARGLLQAAGQELTRRVIGIPRAALIHTGRQRALLDRTATQLAQGARRRVSMELERSITRARRLHLVDPRRVVERGYSILRRKDGSVLTDAGAAPEGTRLEAELKRGALVLRSEGAVERKSRHEEA